MRRITQFLSPFLYFVFLIPAAFLSLGTLLLLAGQSDGMDLLAIVLAALVSLAVFAVGNLVVQYVEQGGRLRGLDHVRQSVLYYVGFFLATAFVPMTWDSAGPTADTGWLEAGLLLCFCAILVNSTFVILASDRKR